MNRKEAAKLVYMAAACFPALQSRDVRWDDTVTAWALVLDDIPYSLGERALVAVLKKPSYGFPQPGEVRQEAEAINKEDWRLAAEQEQERALYAPEPTKARLEDNVRRIRKLKKEVFKRGTG